MFIGSLDLGGLRRVGVFSSDVVSGHRRSRFCSEWRERGPRGPRGEEGKNLAQIHQISPLKLTARAARSLPLFCGDDLIELLFVPPSLLPSLHLQTEVWD